MPSPDTLFETYLVHFLDKDGLIVTNLYVLAPTIHWVYASFKGLIKDEYTVCIEPANYATFDSSLWRKENKDGTATGKEKGNPTNDT